MTKPDIDKLIGRVTSAAPFGSKSVAEPLEDLLRHANADLTSTQTRTLLDGLRSGRCFDALQRTSDTFIDLGSKDPYVHRQLGQALIEQGSFRLAENTLVDSLSSLKPEGKEKSEALGLLGRLYKQKFVDSPKETDRSVTLLNDAIDKYAEAYPLDPAWHGANLVALSAMAKRGNVPLRNAEEPEEYATKLLVDLNKKSETEWTPWDFASAAEASLGQNNLAGAQEYIGKYVNFQRPKDYEVDGFMLAGTARQLSEVWEISADDDGPKGQLLSTLIAASLTQEKGGQFDFKDGELQAFESGIDNANDNDTLEAVFGPDATITHAIMTGLFRRSIAVCQIINRADFDFTNLGTGTGFVVKGSAIHDSLGDALYVLTNNHVLSDNGDFPSVNVGEADVLFHNWNGTHKKKRFRIDKIIDFSERTKLDLTLATIKEFPDELEAAVATFNTSTNALTVDRSRVHLIGHPGGRELSYSVSNNIVKDHDLGDASIDVHRIHYENPTQKGMSGSPVLRGSNLQIVGIHRKGGKIKPIHDDKKPKEGPYQANEAVWAGSMKKTNFGVGD